MKKSDVALPVFSKPTFLTRSMWIERHIKCVGMLTAFAFLAGCALASEQPLNPLAERLLAEGYSCHAVSRPLVLDGRMGDPAWSNAPVLNFYLPPNFAEPRFKTEARVLYDSKYLYVGYKAQDLDVWAYYKNRDDTTCIEDCLEIFFQTDPSRESYYGFEINALGTINDAYYPFARMTRGGHYRWKQWNCDGLITKVGIDGTLNDPSDEDRYWTLEMAIPFAELKALGGVSPKSGDIWCFHLTRCEWGIWKSGEFTSCAPLINDDYHLNKNWLQLHFK